MEYTCEVWDDCTLFDVDKLEKVQLQAARIITGLPIYASRISLYTETGLEPLIDRRKKCKLKILYKVNNQQTPDYIIDIVQSK